MHLAALLAFAALADPFCTDIAKLVEGGREEIPFQTLRDESYKPQLLRYGCFPGGDGYFCQQSMLPPEITAAAMANRIAACLPDAKIAVEKPGRSKVETVVTGSGLQFSLEESQGKGADTGRILRIQITAYR